MPRAIDSHHRTRLLCAIGFMKFSLPVPVLIIMRKVTTAKRKPNLRRMEY
jgi:hypothetical protein